MRSVGANAAVAVVMVEEGTGLRIAAASGVGRALAVRGSGR